MKIKNFINSLFVLLIILNLTNFSNAEESFKNLGKKKVSYLDFFLLKFENKLVGRSQYLRTQVFATRVQYSHVGIQVDRDAKENKIFISIYAVMDKARYTKKNYSPKLSDCNQVRNLIFYRKHGYKFFTQKRDPALSVGVMLDIFKEVFFNNINFNVKEIEFLLEKMFVNVTIFHPVKKKELTCAGKANDYILE